MILGSKARYAVMAMADLAAHAQDRPVRLSEIAERQEMSLAYLEQIFSKLKSRGLVKSTRGPGGGYELARPANALPISEIVVATEEEMKMTRCEAESHTGCMASKEQCLTHDLWQGLSDHIYRYFDTITLDDVCKKRVQRSRI